MAITLAPETLSDAEITDGVGRGELGCAARLWVRYWPTALASSRLFVDRTEVPGLAAEALIGSVSLTALGRGPREDVTGFVIAAVRELGEEEDPPAPDHDDLPELYASTHLTQAFARLGETDADALRAAPEPGALTRLQVEYLSTHLAASPSPDCRATHQAMMAVADGSAEDAFASSHWVHMSGCAWCTEAFHELAFSNVALAVLVAPAVFEPTAVALAPVSAAGAWDDGEPVFGTTAEPVFATAAEAAEPVVPTAEDTPRPHRAAPGGLLASRGRLAALGGGLAAAAAVLALVLTQTLPEEEAATTPSAASGEVPTAPATTGDDATGALDPDVPGEFESPTAAPTSAPSAPSSSVVDPFEPVPSTTGVSPRPSTSPRPASRPTPSASSAPSGTPAPSPSPAPSEPPSEEPSATPTPTPTPRPCNNFQRLFGLC